MFDVKCPKCEKIRQVTTKQSWMVGEIPYEKICKSCCQIGKLKLEECKLKLSAAIKLLQTEEVLKKKSEDRLARPDLCDLLIPGAGGGWNNGLELPERSEETKNKISEATTGIKKTRRN